MKNNVSCIIPTIRNNKEAYISLLSVCYSLNKLNCEKELILIVNRKIVDNDFILKLNLDFDFIKIIKNENKIGSANSRLLGIANSKHEILIFTDDDCNVDLNWAKEISKLAIENGNCTGNLTSKSKNIYGQFEEYTDFYRCRATFDTGEFKFISFPNFCIKKSLLPQIPFSVNSINTVEDIDLSVNLIANNVKIYFSEDIIVHVKYASSLAEIIKRKHKHGKGIAFLKSFSPTKEVAQKILGNNYTILFRWFHFSFTSKFDINQRLLFLIINLIYCFSLIYYNILFVIKKNLCLNNIKY